MKNVNSDSNSTAAPVIKDAQAVAFTRFPTCNRGSLITQFLDLLHASGHDLSYSLLSAVLFATLAAIATCAPAISVASSTNNTPLLYQCTDSEKWTAPGLNRGDCYMALAPGAFVDELRYFDDELVEF